MPYRPNADEVVTQKHVRYFYQPGGPGVGNTLFYGGQNGQYLIIEDQDVPNQGSRTPINVHDPRQIGMYRRIGNQIDPQDFPSATVQFMQKHGAVPRHLAGFRCYINYYQVVGACEDLSDILDGATDYWKIFSFGWHETSSQKGAAFDADEGLMDGLDHTFDFIYPIGKLSFGEEMADEVTLEVVDGVYGSRLKCPGCGGNDDGTQLWYGVQINDTGVPPAVIYTTDGFNTDATAVITGAVDTDVPIAIDIVGRYLVVVFEGAADAGYFFAEINSLTGVPGSFTKVTNGFVASSEPTDIWVSNPREVWFSGKAGYIYKSDNILDGVDVIDAGNATTNDLNRITAIDEVIVAAGASGAVVFSDNRGETFAAVTVAPTANNILALAIWNDFTFWVGTDAGEVFYTNVRGELTWPELTVALTLTQVDDIVWVNGEVGYFTCQTAGPVAEMYATFDGGETWSNSNSRSGRFLNWAVFDVGNRISYPIVPNQEIACDNVVISGLAGNGTDGIVLHGVASKL